MNWIVVIYAVSAVASALAAVLAWMAKLWWAKEYGHAKDETIKSKDSQIERLKGEILSIREITNDMIRVKDAQITSLKDEIQHIKDLTPMKIHEYFISVKCQLEEYIDMLQKQLDKANIDIKLKDETIMSHKSNTEETLNHISKLQEEKAILERRSKYLEGRLRIARKEEDKVKLITDIFFIPASSLKGAFAQVMGRLNRNVEMDDDEDPVEKLFGSKN